MTIDEKDEYLETSNLKLNDSVLPSLIMLNGQQQENDSVTNNPFSDYKNIVFIEGSDESGEISAIPDPQRIKQLLNQRSSSQE